MAITSNYVSEKIFTTNGDQTHLFLVGIRVKALCGAEFRYGTVEDATYVPATTTITLTTGSDDLLASLTETEVGVAAPGSTGNTPVHSHDGSEGSGGPISASATDHATLTHLDYATAGHTGFQPAGSYSTTTDLATTSGTLQDEIDAIVIPTDFYSRVEVDTISGTLNTKIDTTSGTLQDQIDNFSGMEDHANEWHTVDFITDVELTITSGTLQDQIDNFVGMEDHGNEWHNVDFITDSELTVASGVLQDQIDALPSVITTHSGLSDLSYATAGHTGFQEAGSYATTADLATTSGTLQDEIDAIIIPTDFYSRGEVDTISGTLNTKIDTTSGTLQSEIDGITPGITAHSGLSALDYASAGHTNFQPAGDYATNTKVDTASGTLQDQIDDIVIPTDFYSRGEVDTISGTLNDKITLKVNTSDFTELAQDVIGTSVSGVNITVTYNDTTGITTLSGSTGGGGLANVVEDLTPELGGELDTNSKNIRLTPVPADDSASGLIATLTVDTNAVGVGCALYMASDGNFDEADADSTTKMPCTALALETGTGSKKVLLMGFMRNDDWTWTVGGLIYVSITQGVLTQTAPSATTNQVQLVGYATHADRMYFNPIIAMAEVK